MLQRFVNLLIYLVALLLPAYLVRFEIFSLPTNLLELIIIVLLAGWLILKISSALLQFKGSAFFYPIFLIFFGLTLATLFSADLRTSAGIWKSWFIVPWFYLIILVDSLPARKQVNRLLTALTLSGLGVALIALAYWLNGQLTYDGRLKAFYLSPNHLAMYLSPLLIISFYLYFCLKSRFFKILLLVVDCLLLLTIFLTYSYGAWLGLLAAFIFLLIVLWPKRTRLKELRTGLTAISLIFLIFVLAILSQIPSQKFQSLADLSYPSLESRLIIWQSAWRIAIDHPWLGIGPGLFQEYYLNYQNQMLPYLEWAVPQPHNLFLAFWLQTGLVGLTGFIWLLILFFRQIKSSHLISYFLMAAMIYLLAHGLVDTTYWKNDLSIIFWLLIGLSFNRLIWLRRE